MKLTESQLRRIIREERTTIDDLNHKFHDLWDPISDCFGIMLSQGRTIEESTEELKRFFNKLCDEYVQEYHIHAEREKRENEEMIKAYKREQSGIRRQQRSKTIPY